MSNAGVGILTDAPFSTARYLTGWQTARDAVFLAAAHSLSTTPALSKASFRQALANAAQESSPTATETKAATHTVQPGESLTSICQGTLKRQGVAPTSKAVYEAVERVARVNGIQNPDLIQAGQELDLSSLATKGSRLQATLASEASETKTAVAAKSQAGLPSETKAAQSNAAQGTRSSTKVAATKASSAVSSSEDISSLIDALLDDLATAKLAGTSNGVHDKAASTSPLDTEGKPWACLLEGKARVSSPFGIRKDPFTGRPAYHNGVDLAAKSGTSIHPFQEGSVVYSGRKGGYGNLVVVRHSDGTETLYGHTSKNLVKVGETVSTETVIAKVGSTGRSTGPHLHFEVRRNGRAVDPVPLLEQKSIQIAKAL